MKKYLKTSFLTACLVLASNVSQATVMTFDNTTSGVSSTGWNTSGVGVNQTTYVGGHYTEASMTLTADPLTELYTVNPLYNNPVYIPYNSTDYGFFSHGTNTVTLSSTSVFSMQSFNAATIAIGSVATLILTGHVSGGGTLTQTFNTLSPNLWSLFSLTNFNNLTSVNITSTQPITGLDNISYTQSAAVPEPSVFLLLSLGLAGMCWGRRDKLRA